MGYSSDGKESGSDGKEGGKDNCTDNGLLPELDISDQKESVSEYNSTFQF